MDHQMAASPMLRQIYASGNSLQLRQRFDRVAALILTMSSNQPPPSHVYPLRPLPGLANDAHQQYVTSPDSECETDILSTSACESIAPSAPSAQHRSPTVSDGSEDETDIPTASLRSS
ncbi:hypothetical protein E4U52_002658 [Claviceps spartinae]|nr:hypothetical protein E4U52_002658 [Claviceps spartinae]